MCVVNFRESITIYLHILEVIDLTFRLRLASERIIGSIKQRKENTVIVVITGAKDRAEIDYTRHGRVLHAIVAF